MSTKEDELDYMSDIFITDVSSTTSKRHKETSISSSSSCKRSKAKKLQKRKDNLKRKSTASVLEQQVREEGLSKPLSVDNKGYSLLCKMGYIQGETLGKSGEDGI